VGGSQVPRQGGNEETQKPKGRVKPRSENQCSAAGWSVLVHQGGEKNTKSLRSIILRIDTIPPLYLVSIGITVVGRGGCVCVNPFPLPSATNIIERFAVQTAVVAPQGRP